MNIKGKLNKIRKFFIGTDGIFLTDINETLTLENGFVVESIQDGFVENAEFETVYFEDLTDKEMDNLYTIVENLEVDEEKTLKRCKN